MRILSFNNKQKSLWKAYQSLNLFFRFSIVTAILIIIVTPFITGNLLIFKPRAQALFVFSARSGDWSDPTMWSTGVVPKDGDSVGIGTGHTVIYNVLSDNVLGEVSIDGTLKFSRATNTRLKSSDNIIVKAGGVLDMGTSNDFIPKNVKAEVIWVLSQAQADAYVGGFKFQTADKGLWAMDGSLWEVHGFPLVRSWSKISQDASLGSNTITVDNDVSDWYIGGTVVITSTSTNPKENELRIITALEKQADGKTKITFDKPLSFKHEGTAPFKGEVGLLTRNILFKTELTGASEATLQSDVGTRKFAHTIHMGGAKGDTQYAEFKYMGHYKILSRYPIHPHMMGSVSNGMVIRGNGLWYTGFRWINIHSSDNLLVEDNVGYSSAGAGYFEEIDVDCTGAANCTTQGTTIDISQSIAFIRNLGVESRSARFEDRGSIVEYWRFGTFWLNALGEAHFGNVAVGARTDGGNGAVAGYSMDEVTNNQPGTMGMWFIHNEAHSNEDSGHSTWSNFGVDTREIVDSFYWRNTDGMGTIGAYTGEFYIFNAKLLENTIGIASTVIDLFTQDSLIAGSPTNLGEAGNKIEGYFAEQSPMMPHAAVRNKYKNLKAGYMHRHDSNSPSDKEPNVNCNTDPSGKMILTVNCSADYSLVAGNTFENVQMPIDFGWHANANSWHKVTDFAVPGSALPKDFMIIRKDQTDAAKRTAMTNLLFNSQTFYSPEVDALVTPMSSLSSTLQMPKDNSGGTFAFSTAVDYPPQISLAVTTSGKTATMKATVSDDKNPNPTVEFYVDWVKIGTKTAPPYEWTADLSNISDAVTSIAKRKYAYLWARAFDGAVFSRIYRNAPDFKQRAYADAVEIGPEILLAGQTVPVTPTPILTTPTPTPIPTFTPTPTPTLIPTLTPTPTLKPTSTPTPTFTPTPKPTSTPTPTPIKLFNISGTICFDSNSDGSCDGLDAAYDGTKIGAMFITITGAPSGTYAINNLAKYQTEDAYILGNSYSVALQNIPTGCSSILNPAGIVIPNANVTVNFTVLCPVIKVPSPTPTSPPIPTLPPVSTPIPTLAPSPTSAPIPTSSPTPTPALACALTSAVWNLKNATEGQAVILTVTGNSACDGKQLSFEVRENDSILEGGLDEPAVTNPVNATFLGTTAVGSWTAEWQNDCNGLCLPPEYFFKASLVSDPTKNIRSSDPLLEVAKAAGPPPIPTPTVSPVFLTISSLNKRRIFLDKPESVKLSGSNFIATEDFLFRLKSGAVTKLELTVKPLNSNTIDVNLASNTGFPALASGLYEVAIARALNPIEIKSSQSLLITKLGDLWSSTSTETSEEPRDGKIDIFDVSRLLSKWNSADPKDLLDADINSGPEGVSIGKIDLYDVNKLMSNWTKAE